jgi:hypothetical protein
VSGVDRRPSDWRRTARASVVADLTLLALACAAAIVAVADPAGPARPLLVLCAACLLPGGALLTRLRVDDLVTALGLAVGLSMCAEAIGALAMVWTGWWHPVAFAIGLGVVACAALLLDAVRAIAVLCGEALV